MTVLCIINISVQRLEWKIIIHLTHMIPLFILYIMVNSIKFILF